MEKTIANQATPSQVTGRLATWHRVMEEAGLEYDDLQTPIDDPNFRGLLVEFWRRRGVVIVSSAAPVVPQPLVVIRSVDELLTEWADFYYEIGAKVDLSGLKVPTRREGFDQLIVVARGMSPERVFQKCNKHFGCWKYTDKKLDEVVFDVDGFDRKYRRSDHEIQAVWVRDRAEADQELKNRSANDLAAAKIPGITLEARELYGLKYFMETGKSLDQKSITLSTGSRCVGGGVPGVCWASGHGKKSWYTKMNVDWYHPSCADDRLRSRETVS